MPTLDQALLELERTNPDVKAARIRLDETIDSIVARGKIQPDIDAAKRQAMLDLLGTKYKDRDHEGLNATIIAVTFRGYEIGEGELRALLMQCDAETIEWWLDECDLCDQHSPHDHH